MKYLLIFLLLPGILPAQIDNEALKRVPENFYPSGKIYLKGESIFLNLVQKTVRPDGSISSYYASVIELDLQGKIKGNNQFGEVTFNQPMDLLTEHPTGVLVLAANTNVRLHQFSREGQPRKIHEFEKGVIAKFLGRYNDEELIAVIKKSEVISTESRSKDMTELRGQIWIYGLDDENNLTEKYFLRNLILKENEFSLPVLMNDKFYFINPQTGVLCIHEVSSGQKFAETNLQLKKDKGEEVHWSEPVVHPDNTLLLRLARVRTKPSFRFVESWIYKIDSSGNKINEKKLYEFTEPERSHSMMITSRKDLLLFIHSSRPELFLFDEKMNLLWEKNYKLKNTFLPVSIAELPDKNILLLAFTEHLGKTKPFLIVLSKDGRPVTLMSEW